MKHRHGAWHRFRTWLGLRIIPKCVRAEIWYLYDKEQISQAVAGLIFGNIAEQDQAAATLRDLGKRDD